MKNLFNEKSRESFGSFVKRFRLLLIGIVLVPATIYIQSLIFENWQCVIFIVIECVAGFIAAVIKRDLRITEIIGWTLIYMATNLLAISLLVIISLTSISIAFLAGHLLGWIIFALVALFPEKESLQRFTFTAIFSSFILFSINVFNIDNKKSNINDCPIDDVKIVKVEKVFSEVKQGQTYYTFVTAFDTIEVAAEDYPTAKFVDTSYKVKFSKSGNKIVKIDIGKACP